MKKRFVLLGVSAISGFSCLSIIGMRGGSLFSNNGVKLTADCLSCQGNHYTSKKWSGVAMGKNGIKEYWVCCNCNKHYFSTESIQGGYDETKWVDKGEAAISTSDPADDRIWFGGTEKIYSINHLSQGNMVIDGQRDDLYDAATKYNFEKAIWPENGGSNLTATLEALWQGKMLYIYVDVNDPTKAQKDCSDTSETTESYDNIQFRIDTLHSEKYATSTWDGWINANYRSDKAVLGKFRVASGYDLDSKCNSDISVPESSSTDGDGNVTNGDATGCWMDNWTYLSGCCRNDDKTYIKSHYYTDTHYGYEFAIYFGHGATVVNDFGEIGMLFKINDKSAKNVHQGIINFENIGDGMDFPRNFSNFRLVDYTNN